MARIALLCILPTVDIEAKEDLNVLSHVSEDVSINEHIRPTLRLYESEQNMSPRKKSGKVTVEKGDIATRAVYVRNHLRVLWNRVGIGMIRVPTLHLLVSIASLCNVVSRQLGS